MLAYSKEQKQPGDTIHVLFTSNGKEGDLIWALK
jgi:hypothetical protein